MLIVPAVAVGALVVGCLVFFAGFSATYLPLSWIAKMRRRAWHKGRQRLTEETINRIAMVVGLIAVVGLVLSLFVLPRDTLIVLWIALTALGFLVALITWVLSIGQ